MPNTREKLIELLDSVQDYGFFRSTAEEPQGRVMNRIVADFLIANGVTVQQWIPVTERLPEEVGQPVLVLASNCYDQTHIVKAFLDYHSPGFFRTTEKQYDGIWGAWEVSNWMPMPQPPKEGCQ